MAATFPVNKVNINDLQCNLLRSTERPRSTQVFRRFERRGDMAAWLSSIAAPTSATSTSSTALNIFFTLAGLKFLGVPEEKLAQMDSAFRRGARAKATLEKLGDGKVDGWGPHALDWHAVEIHGHDANYPPKVDERFARVVEHGGRIAPDGSLRTDAGPSYGHFKVFDGISNPVYTQQDYDQLVQKTGEPQYWDPRSDLSTLLVPDVLANTPGAFGSYFVFRKLKQNVVEFERRIDVIAEEIETRRTNQGQTATSQVAQSPQPLRDSLGKLPPDARFRFNFGTGTTLRENIKRMIFGRGKAGDALVSSQTNGNDFDYRDDPDGTLCPFHAHIRKMNPRGDTGDRALERTKVLARRGISYYQTDVHKPDALVEQHQDKGLLFWCAQANIGDQFEYVQAKWANGSNVDASLLPTPDVDTVIGHLDPKHLQPLPNGISAWERWKTTSDIDYSVWSAICLVGADYFYAPSITGFQFLQTLNPQGGQS